MEHQLTMAGAEPPQQSGATTTAPTRPGPARRDAAVPVSAPERLDVLDVLRGFAICGILLVNIEVLSGRLFLPADVPTLLGGALDGGVWLVLATVVYGKLFPLFSFLFGVGFGVFIERAAGRHAAPVALFRRRLLGLLCIGLAHSFLIWFGDILTLYALLGFLLILFVHRSDRTVLSWSLAILPVPVLIVGIRLLLTQWGPGVAPAGADAGAIPIPSFVLTAVDHFGTGSYWDVVRANATFTIFVALRRVNQAPRVFAMFLFGLYAARQGVFANIGLWRPRLRKGFWWGLAIGLPLSMVAAQLPEVSPTGPVTFAAWMRVVVETVGAPALCLCYISGLTLLFHTSRGRRWLAPLMPMGRMALTNYLLQSIICVAIFYGIGLGLFRHVSLTVAVLIALAVLALEAVLSAWWLRRAAFGPAEWLWRQFTYGRRSAMGTAVHHPAK